MAIIPDTSLKAGDARLIRPNRGAMGDSIRNEAHEPRVIPNFCGLAQVFTLMMAGELLALVFTMLSSWRWHSFWTDLGLISLFVQWSALGSAALLCLCRPWLNRLRDDWAAWSAFGLMMLALTVMSQLAYMINQQIDANLLDHMAFMTRSLAVGGMVTGISARYLYVLHLWRRQLQAEASARVQLLQARIRPHFLFNSMNTIASLTRTRPRDAERLVEDLCDLFRVSLDERRERASLHEEIELTRRYLDIEQMRLGERLAVRWEVEAPLDAALPPLTLQPLVENAVYHGIEPRADGGLISIAITAQKGCITIQVRNPLPEQRTHKPLRQGSGMALRNITERLQLWYKNAANLSVGPVNREFKVCLVVPYESINAFATGQRPDSR